MTKFEWMVTPEKCGDFWKVGVQDETGAVYFSKKSYTTKEAAFKVAVSIYKEEEFVVSDFVYDYQN
jgi:hypothetical protein